MNSNVWTGFWRGIAFFWPSLFISRPALRAVKDQVFACAYGRLKFENRGIFEKIEKTKGRKNPKDKKFFLPRTDCGKV